MIRTLDLFSGIGGFSLGLRYAGGFETAGFCEINPFCRQVLKKNFPGTYCHDDITNLTPQIVKKQCGPIDLVCGGFPCQDVSLIGKGKGLAGQRSGLWHEMRRVIRFTKPAWCLIENVIGLRSRGGDEVQMDLEDMGYTCWPCVVPASAADADHERKRVWIVSHAASFRRNGASNSGDQFNQGVSSAVETEECQPTGRCNSDARRIWKFHQPGMARTIPRFSSRLDKHRIHAIGNSVVPQVVEMFGRWISEVERNWKCQQ